MIEYIIGFIAPHHCLGCGAEGALLCVECEKRLQRVVPRCYRCGASKADFRTCISCRSSSELFQAWTFTRYDTIAKALVHALKYERARAGADDMARCLSHMLPVAPWVVCHVPTATTRVRQRGYDQAQVMARSLAKYTNTPYVPLLARLGQNQQVGQKGLTRREQMKDVFAPLRLEHIEKKHILLIDDVLTTGATLESAAAVLKAAGARRVSAAVFAVA